MFEREFIYRFLTSYFWFSTFKMFIFTVKILNLEHSSVPFETRDDWLKIGTVPGQSGTKVWSHYPIYCSVPVFYCPLYYHRIYKYLAVKTGKTKNDRYQPDAKTTETLTALSTVERNATNQTRDPPPLRGDCCTSFIFHRYFSFPASNPLALQIDRLFSQCYRG